MVGIYRPEQKMMEAARNTRHTASLSHKRCAVGVALLLATIMCAVFCTAGLADNKLAEGILGPDEWPTTVEDTVRDILPRISTIQWLEIKTTSKDNVISLYSEFGVGIRDRYGLWRGNDKLILSACGFRCHPDDASMKIIEAVWQELQK